MTEAEKDWIARIITARIILDAVRSFSDFLASGGADGEA